MREARLDLVRVALVGALLLGAAGAWAEALASGRRASGEGVILFFGDSLTAGYGLDPELAFPARVQEMISERGWDYRVVNAGVSGETSSGGLRRIDWVLRQKIDVLVLELGANDALRGTDLTLTAENLQAIIERTRALYPDVEIVLAGMRVPPNLGADYTEAFAALFSHLADFNDTHLIPFLLDGVGGVAELNQADGIHPNPEGHRMIADNVWAVLAPILAHRDGRAAGRQLRSGAGRQ